MTDSEIYEVMQQHLAKLRSDYKACRDAKDPNTHFALGLVTGYQEAMDTFYEQTAGRGKKRSLD